MLQPRKTLLMTALMALTLTLALSAAHAQTYTVLNNFGFIDQGIPEGQVTQGRDGNLYGITATDGAIYKMTTAGVETLQVSTMGPNSNCYSGMILGTDGNFYGTCLAFNNTSPNGGVFKFTPGTGTVTILANFSSPGQYPSPLVQAADGNFYGVTENLTGTFGVGTAYKITTAGVMTTIHNFAGPPNEPSNPTYIAPLIQAKDGNLYGTSLSGCHANNSGCVFKMTTAGVVTIVADLNQTGNSAGAYAGVIQGTDGLFYGATQLGNPVGANDGTVYKVTGGGAYTLLHAFNEATDNGGFTTSALIQATDGNLYSTANGCYAGGCQSGNVFKVTTKGVYTTLTALSPSPCTNSGCLPSGPLTQHTNGTFYGVTQQGGTAGHGVFFSQTVSPALGAFVSIQQKSGNVGATVNVLGQGFNGATSVKFGGVAATSFTKVSDTFLTAIVPTGAITGKLTVIEGATTLTSAQTYSVKAKFTSFTPTSGPVGTLVTINGTGLTQVSKVTFNNVVATSFTVVSDSKVTATVPTGATTGKIVVTNPAGTAASATNFTVK